VSTDQLQVKNPPHTQRSWLWAALFMAVPLAVTWAVAFAITGLMWWGAPQKVEPVPPPPPPELAQVDTADIDLERYGRAHPMWMP
jgi:hypothetical protein